MAKPTPQQESFTELLPLCKAMKMKVTDVDTDIGAATITMPYDPEMIGDPETGVIHGGPVSVLLDSVSGLAVTMHPENTAMTATIDLRIDYMRPSPAGENLTASAQVYHTTRTVAFIRATAWAEDETKPIAQATGAFVFAKKAAS